MERCGPTHIRGTGIRVNDDRVWGRLSSGLRPVFRVGKGRAFLRHPTGLVGLA